MDEVEIWRAAEFLIRRRGPDLAKQWAAHQAMDVADPEARAVWLRILQAVIDMRPSTDADTPLN
jgi:hypothetical protein